MALLNDKGVVKIWYKVKSLISTKVDKELKSNSATEYKVLSDNNLTDEMVQKIHNSEGGGFSGNYADLRNVPSEFPPTEHKHRASDINTGALPIVNGGTGATTAAQALTNLGLTATASELNKLDGVTATTTELNHIKGVTSNIQKQLNRIFCNHNPGYSSSQTGYIKLAHLEIKEGQGGSTSHPLTLKIISRYVNAPIYLTILFGNDGANTNDPTIKSFNWYGGTADAFKTELRYNIEFIAHKTSAGVWDIYAKKVSGWQTILIENYSYNHLFERTIDFSLTTNEYLNEKPTENVVEATIATGRFNVQTVTIDLTTGSGSASVAGGAGDILILGHNSRNTYGAWYANHPSVNVYGSQSDLTINATGTGDFSGNNVKTTVYYTYV